jgi:hypothetical protein
MDRARKNGRQHRDGSEEEQEQCTYRLSVVCERKKNPVSRGERTRKASRRSLPESLICSRGSIELTKARQASLSHVTPQTAVERKSSSASAASTSHLQSPQPNVESHHVRQRSCPPFPSLLVPRPRLSFLPPPATRSCSLSLLLPFESLRSYQSLPSSKVMDSTQVLPQATEEAPTRSCQPRLPSRRPPSSLHQTQRPTQA